MDIVIVGGGASGMMLAAMMKDLPHDTHVTLLEKNTKLGKKLLLTGSGKCNFTSGDFTDLIDVYNNDFARNLYKNHDERSYIDFFKKIGIEAKIEVHKGLKYYYPCSNKATSVYYNLIDKIIANGVDIKYDSKVISIKKDSHVFSISLSDGKTITADKVIIATGGKSYENTGSSGDGLLFAKDFGHNIVKALPGLTSLRSDERYFKDLKGVRCDAKVSYGAYTEIGEVQFTEYGLSGIPVLNISSKVTKDIQKGNKVTLSLDFMIKKDTLKKRVQDISYKKVEDFLCGLIPDEIGLLIMKMSGAKLKNLACTIDDKMIDTIYDYLSSFKVNIDKTSGFENAQVTIGGVDTNEINPDTLESKLVPSLYFMGEVLDIDGKCGGYNLQLAYSSACAVYGGVLNV